MAIQIIVDGYNLIGSHKGLRGKLEHLRKTLIDQLQKYHERKGYPITVVFDGWRSGWISEIEEKVGDLTVIFSRQGEKADAVIQRLALELEEACVVVSSDREVRMSVQANGATAIYAREFDAILRGNSALDQPAARAGNPRATKKGNPRKLSKSERKRRNKLGRL
jgi:predicted RNA-binding protein with PIN domain